jgi:hypothetical protein
MSDTRNSKERRKLQRQKINYYLPIRDDTTGKIIGHMADLSQIGILMEAAAPIPAEQTYHLRLDFMEDIAGQASLDFDARCKWCQQDKILPYLYYVGFEITNLPPQGIEVVKSIAEKYGTN